MTFHFLSSARARRLAITALVCSVAAAGCASRYHRSAPEIAIPDATGDALVVFVTADTPPAAVEPTIAVDATPTAPLPASDGATLPERYAAARDRLCQGRMSRAGPSRDRCLDYALTVALADPGHSFVERALEPSQPPRATAPPQPTRVTLVGGPETTTPAPPQPRQAPRRTAQGGGAYTVQSGDTLWRISERLYGDGRFAQALFDANRDILRTPDLIQPGQILAVPPIESGRPA